MSEPVALRHGEAFRAAQKLSATRLSLVRSYPSCGRPRPGRGRDTANERVCAPVSKERATWFTLPGALQLTACPRAQQAPAAQAGFTDDCSTLRARLLPLREPFRFPCNPRMRQSIPSPVPYSFRHRHRTVQ